MNKFQIVGEIVWVDLTQGKKTCIDLADLPLVLTRRWCAKKDHKAFYGQTNIRSCEGKHTTLTLHSFLTGAKLTDHKDRDGLNNLRSNLRAATNQQNTANSQKRPGGSSIFKGVSWCPRDRNWAARIVVNGDDKFLGKFTEELDAARAYDVAAKETFGEFARLNFPEGHKTPDPNQNTVPAIVV
jgi:AP2 domain